MYKIYEIPALNLIGLTREDFSGDTVRELAVDVNHVDNMFDVANYFLDGLNGGEADQNYYVVVDEEEKTIVMGGEFILSILPE